MRGHILSKVGESTKILRQFKKEIKAFLVYMDYERIRAEFVALDAMEIKNIGVKRVGIFDFLPYDQ